MRFIATLSLSLISAASLCAEAPSVEGTLPEDLLPQLRPLLQMAVERSPNTIAASLAVAQQAATKIQTDAVLWPSVGVNGSYQSSYEQESTSSLNSQARGFVYGATASQPLFQFGALRNQAAMGALGLKIAERQYAEAYRLLAASIREQYMALVSKNISLRNARFALELANVQLKAAQAKFDSGASSKAELQDTQLSAEQAKLDCDRTETDYAYSKQVFIRLVGIDSLGDESVPLMVPHAEYQPQKADLVLTGFVGQGIESTFQSQVYDMEVKQQDLNYKIQSVRLLPKFNANVGYTYTNYTSLSTNSISQIGLSAETVSVSGFWTVFDGFATRGAKLSALESKRMTERQKKSYIDSTIDAITYMRHQLDLSARAMRLAEVHDALIEAQVKRFTDDQALGYASKAIIDAGVVNLNATELLMANARSDYLSRWTDFVSLAGIDPALANISPRYVH
jgi:outer membrane protein TolC